MKRSHQLMLGTAVVALGVFSNAGTFAPPAGHAFDLREGLRAVERGANQVVRTVTEEPERLLQGAGAALVVGGLVEGEAAPVIIGAILVAAPEVFRNEMRETYRDDYAWSGCVNCNQRRVLVAPGRTVSDEQRTAARSMATEDARDLQGALQTLGYYTMRIDGDFGPGSRRAVNAFQASLGAEETGVLTAEQRAELFAQAEQQGYVRLAALGKLPAEAIGEVPAQNTDMAPTVAGPAIAEFRLASSRMEAFTTDYLLTGSATNVKQASLRADGIIDFVLHPSPGGTEDIFVSGGAEAIDVAPHPLSDRWIRVSITPLDGSDPVVLNVIDTFDSAEAAQTWSGAARDDAVLLARLTERELPGETVVVTADTTPPAVEDDSTTVIVVPQVTEADRGVDTTTVLVAEAPSANQGAVAEPVEDDGVVDTTTALVAPSNDLVAQPAVGRSTPDVCRQTLYVSFSFPDGDDPINHYNITPPDNTLMMDNGDSTAYITGRCVQGTYDFSYVTVKHDEDSSTWEHFVREGSFEVASNHEQCAIDLNTPDGSANLQCF